MIEQLDVYLMGPYTWRGDESQRRAMECSRYRTITQFAAQIMAAGLTLHSPITHCHPMTEYAALPGTWDYWQKQDRANMQICRECWQLRMPGYQQSTGCQAEFKMALELGKTVRMVEDTAEGVERVIEEYKRSIRG